MTEALLSMLLTGVVRAGVGVHFGGDPSERDRLYPFFAVGNIAAARQKLTSTSPAWLRPRLRRMAWRFPARPLKGWEPQPKAATSATDCRNSAPTRICAPRGGVVNHLR